MLPLFTFNVTFEQKDRSKVHSNFWRTQTETLIIFSFQSHIEAFAKVSITKIIAKAIVKSAVFIKMFGK